MINKLKFAKLLRTNQTDIEMSFWYYCRAKRMQGIKFKRQATIGKYIVDFVCYEKSLIIEFDGGQHNELEIQQKDIERTKFLESRGFRVLRFWNNKFLENKEGVLDEINKFF
jgi:very-short-patch-repair endonuclease